MNEDEFLKELADLKGQFEIRENGELRTKDKCLCPILTVFAKRFPNASKWGLKNSDYRETGDALGLGDNLITVIVRAADNSPNYDDNKLRKKMLAALL